MPLVPIELPPGVVKKATPLQSTGRYWDANLVRWRSGKLLPVGGWQRITASPLASAVRGLFSWKANSGNTLTLIGCASQLYVLSGSTYTNITPIGYTGEYVGSIGGYGAWEYGDLLYGDDTDPTYPRPESLQFFPSFSWTIDNWGGEVLAVASSDGRLLHWKEGEAVAHEVGRAPVVTAVRTSNIVTIVTSYASEFYVGQEIAVIGVLDNTMDGTFVIDNVISPTSFTYQNVGSNSSSSGGIVRTVPAVPTSNRAVVVTSERYAVLFGAGGNPRRVAWSNQEDYTNWDYANTITTAGFLDLDTTSEIIMAAPVREGTLIWTTDEVWLMRYVGLPYVYGIERIGYGCGLMAPKSFALTAGRCIWMGKEGFWTYDGGVVKPLPCDVGSYVFDNIDRDSGALYSHGSDNGVFTEVWFWYPSSGQSAPDRYVCYNYAEGWWSIGAMARTAAQPAGVYNFPMAAGTDRNLYFHEDGWTNAGTPITTARYAETASINVQSGGKISNVVQAITDSGYGFNSTRLTFFSEFTPEGSEITSGPYTPRSDGYTDTRVTGRDFRVKISSAADADWSIGEMRLEVRPTGDR